LRELSQKEGRRYTEKDFRTKTAAYQQITGLHSALDPFSEHLGRTHVIRLDTGGFFPPHRDAIGPGEPHCFRLIMLLGECGRDGFVLLHSGQRIFLDRGILYYLDVRHEHALFSFIDNCLVLVMNVLLNEESVELVLKHMVNK
jgi:hypothetical protein